MRFGNNESRRYTCDGERWQPMVAFSQLNRKGPDVFLITEKVLGQASSTLLRAPLARYRYLLGGRGLTERDCLADLRQSIATKPSSAHKQLLCKRKR